MDQNNTAIRESQAGSDEQENQAVRYHIRFSVGQRYLHAVLFSTFIGLALTGLPLRFSHSFWAERFAHVVGGFGAILFFHKFCAVLLTVAFLTHVGNLLYRGFVKHERSLFWGPNSLVPRAKDAEDIFQHIRWFLWLGPRPKFDRFSYWEKFDYWAVFWGMAVIGLSGYTMWFAPFFSRFIPGSWLNIALVLHGEEALLAVWFIFTVHFFNTHLRPESFPMDMVIFTGKESEEEFRHKRPEEYRRLRETGQFQSETTTAAPQLWLKNFARVLGSVIVLIGFTLLVLTLIAFFRS
jgi:cytochrome b subunit of formate dehydrogenase